MSDENMEIDLIANAGQPIREAKQLAESMSLVIGKFGQLEAMVNTLFTKEGHKLAQLEQTMRFFANPNWKAQAQQIGAVANQLSAGGTVTKFSTAAVRGQIANIKSDPVYQGLQLDKARNEVLGQRYELYRKMREVLPDNATGAQRLKAWQQTMQAFGAPQLKAGTEAYKKARMQAAQDVAAFETRIKTEQMVAMDNMQAKLDDARRAATDRAFRAQVRTQRAEINQLFNSDLKGLKLLPAGEREGAYQAARQRIGQYAEQQGFAPGAVDDRTLRRKFDAKMAELDVQEVAAKEREVVAQQKLAKRAEERAAKAAAAKTPAAIQTRAEESIQNQRTRMGAFGGAGVFSNQLQYLGNFAAMGSIIGTITFAAKSTIEFQSALKKLQAIANATDTEMKHLKTTILDVGVNTKFSVKELSEAATTMAQAGYSAQQIAKILKPVSELAAGTGSSLQDAANITTSVLSTFNISVDHTTEITNMMAAALNQSKLSLEQLQLGLQYSGNTAASSGIQIEELTAALGAMADTGIKSGSTLGTGLRALIVGLENPTKKFKKALDDSGMTMEDVNIKSQGLYGVLKNLKDHGFGETEKAMGSFEIRAAAALIALTNNIDGLEKLQTGIVGTSAAVQANATQMDTFSAQWTRMTNAVTGFVSVAGAPMLGAITSMIGGFATLLHGTLSLAPAFQILITLLTAFAVSKATTFVLGLLAGLIRLRTGLTAGAIAMGLLNAAGLLITGRLMAATAATTALGLAFKMTPLGWLTLGITALVTAFQWLNGTMAASRAKLDELNSSANEAQAEADNYRQRSQELSAVLERLVDQHGRLSTKTDEAAAAAVIAQQKFAAWGLQIRGNINDVNNLISALDVLIQKQAAARLGKLLEAQGSLDKAVGESAGNVRRISGSLRNPTASFGPERLKMLGVDPNQFYGTLRKAQGGDQVAIAAMIEMTRNLRGKVGSGFFSGSGELARLERNLQTLAGAVVTNTQAVEKANANRAEIPLAMIDAGEAGASSRSASRGAIMGLNQDFQQASRLKGRARAQAEVDAYAKARAELERVDSNNRAQAEKLLADPRTRAQYEAAAKKAGVPSGVDYVVGQLRSADPNYTKLSLMGGRPTPQASIAQMSALETSLRRRGKKAEADSIADQIRLRKIAEDPNSTPEDYLGAQDALAGTEGQRAGGGGGSAAAAGRRADRNEAQTLERTADALKKQIDTMSASLGPTPQDKLDKGDEMLKPLLKQWYDAKVGAIKAGGAGGQASAGDIADRLAAFEVEAQDYFSEVLDGNAQRALEMMAEVKEQAASDAAGMAETKADLFGYMHRGIEAVDEQIKITEDAYDAAMKARIEAIKRQFAAEHNMTPEQVENSAEVRAEIDKVKRETASAIADSISATLGAFRDGVKRAAEEAKLKSSQDLARAEAGANAANNRYNTGIGDAHKAQAQYQLDDNREADAKTQVEETRKELEEANRIVADFEKKLSEATDEAAKKKISDELKAAKDEARGLNEELEQAKNHYTELTGKVEPIASFTEAMAVAAGVWARQIGLGKPIFEQIADGMVDVMTTMSNSLAENIGAVLKGQKTIAQGFGDLMKSIFDALMDMAAKIIAQEVLMWVLQMVGLSIPGVNAPAGSNSGRVSWGGWGKGGKIGTGKAGGGPIPGIAGQGDTILTPTSPGEYVVRATAVDAVGIDTMHAINSMSNRRAKAASSAREGAAPPPKQPDNVNVYVVSKDNVPPPSKDTIVAYVVDDMVRGGRTKTLIKQIQVGAA